MIFLIFASSPLRIDGICGLTSKISSMLFGFSSKRSSEAKSVMVEEIMYDSELILILPVSSSV